MTNEVEVITADTEVIAPAPQELESRSLVAIDIGDMPVVQRQLITICDRKMAELSRDLAEAQENFEHAKKMKWRTSAFRSLITRCEKQLIYYEKVKAAVEAGCVVCPPMPGAEVVAIRTNRARPKPNLKTTRSSWSPTSLTQTPDGLKIGEGEYKSPNPTTYRDAIAFDEQGNPKLWEHWAEEFQLVEFPVAVVNPKILNAASEAMKLKIFDSIEVVGAPRRKADPILIGRIKDPRPHREGITFFLAWWLDPETI